MSFKIAANKRATPLTRESSNSDVLSRSSSLIMSPNTVVRHNRFNSNPKSPLELDISSRRSSAADFNGLPSTHSVQVGYFEKGYNFNQQYFATENIPELLSPGKGVSATTLQQRLDADGTSLANILKLVCYS